MEETTNQTPQSSEATESQDSFAIPEEYQGKGWTEKVSNYDDLWKLTANSQSLIGKRPAGIPEANASDDEWQKFNRALGVPDEPKYEFSQFDLPENTGFDLESYDNTMQQLFHKAGLTPKQADTLRSAYLESELNTSNERTAELDKRFDEITSEVFGEDFAKYRDQTIEAFDRFSPQNLKGALSAIEDQPEALAAIVATIKGLNGEIESVKKQYTGEDTLSSGTQTSNKSYDEIVTEQAQLRASAAYKTFTHPEHKATLEKVKQMDDTLRRMKR